MGKSWSHTPATIEHCRFFQPFQLWKPVIDPMLLLWVCLCDVLHRIPFDGFSFAVNNWFADWVTRLLIPFVVLVVVLFFLGGGYLEMLNPPPFLCVETTQPPLPTPPTFELSTKIPPTRFQRTPRMVLHSDSLTFPLNSIWLKTLVIPWVFNFLLKPELHDVCANHPPYWNPGVASAWSKSASSFQVVPPFSRTVRGFVNFLVV